MQLTYKQIRMIITIILINHTQEYLYKKTEKKILEAYLNIKYVRFRTMHQGYKYTIKYSKKMRFNFKIKLTINAVTLKFCYTKNILNKNNNLTQQLSNILYQICISSSDSLSLLLPSKHLECCTLALVIMSNASFKKSTCYF